MTHTDFLLARYDEEAEAASGLQRRAQEHELDCRDPRVLGTVVPGWGDWPNVQKMAARVLADIAAKRQLVELHEGWHVCVYSRDSAADRGATDFCDDEDALGPCPTLLALAQPYADHSDFQPEWKS